jgi:hypothetical protein
MYALQREQPEQRFDEGGTRGTGERINGNTTVTRQRKRGVSPARTRRASTGTALTSFDDVRRIAHELPGVVDSTSYGTPALKVGGKLFARLHQSMDCVVLRCELLDREILMQSAPDALFITDHYRDHPWILLRFGVVEKRVLPELIERAWRLVASKTLIREQDNER